MKADKFIKTLRTIIREEVRLAVRQEMEMLLEQPIPTTTTLVEEVAPVPDLRSKYAKILGDDEPIKFKAPTKAYPTKVPVNINDILAETAKSMRTDPGNSEFYEGLR